jgi:hypothetical protein
MLEGNRLLEALTPSDRTLIQPLLTEVRLAQGDLLFEAHDLVRHAYFPTDHAAASYFVFLDDGDAVETVLVGREGCIGGIVSHGRLPAYSRGAVVQEGTFYRIGCNELADLSRRSAGLENELRRYADFLMAQLFQTIGCNVTHSIEQRAAKWLCAVVDLTQQPVISMTQEQLALRMGSGRSYASRVIQRFKRDGLLVTRRGGIEVLDYQRLRARACDCNELVREHYETILRR